MWGLSRGTWKGVSLRGIEDKRERREEGQDKGGLSGQAEKGVERVRRRRRDNSRGRKPADKRKA